MSLVRFYYGTPSELDNKEYEEGSLYLRIPERDASALAQLYFDVDGVRRGIGASYNDLAIWELLNELDRVCLVHCTSLSMSEDEVNCSIDGNALIIANVMPLNITDQIFWNSSDETVAIITGSNYDDTTGEATAIVTPQAAGVCTITVQCGNYSASCSLEIIDAQWLITYLLAENYSPAGNSFSYIAPIGLSNCQSIETQIDLDTVTTAKQNLISIGDEIGEFNIIRNAPRIHIYSSQTVSNLKKYLRLAFIASDLTNKTGIEYPIQNLNNSTIVTIKLNYEGLWINDVLYVPPDNATKNVYNSVISDFQSKTSFNIGSLEGANRSTAYYNYIKYTKYEPAV